MKTGFVTLLMIGIAETGCGQSKPKISIPAGQFDAATFKGPWPTKKVDCIDLGNNYFNVHYQDGAELHFADSRPNRDVPPIPDPLPADVDNADLCAELHADKPAKPPAKKALAPCHDGMWYEGRESICLPDGSVPAVKKGVTLPVHAITSEEMSRLRPDCTGKREYRDGYCKDPTPLDVPAIRKTRKDEPEPTYPTDMDSMSMCYQWDDNLKRCMAGSIDQEGLAAKRQEWAILHAHWLERKKHATVGWTCPDPDAYSLQISVSGKAANCHRIAP